jgi:hypothetical protein
VLVFGSPRELLCSFIVDRNTGETGKHSWGIDRNDLLVLGHAPIQNIGPGKFFCRFTAPPLAYKAEKRVEQ